MLLQLLVVNVQYRLLIPAFKAWVDRAWYTTARPIAAQFPVYGQATDVKAERGIFIRCYVGH